MTVRSRTALFCAASKSLARRRIRKPIGGFLAFSAALVLVFTTATAAQAHYVYQDDEVWSNTDSSKCLYTYAEVSHGSGGGYAKSYALASSGIPLSESCILVWNRPPGNLKTGWQYYYWDGSQWGICQQLAGDQNPDGTWTGYTNTTKTSRMELTYDFGIAPPCGGGYYGTMGAGAVYYGGQWYGNTVSIWSGQHFIEP
ncbi:hypothetical protein [Streptomyces montanisoli]|uniref:Uncharacterized protein n=1 Tax=Streptomyces montanisoli TaxID=2798581 RepID=A0A940MC01_9ACTN|nr:hypothetical protein [Streptomyces montanisoli]MBP0460170.1 hypothetical protein [Streptomyces montanisoli]